MTLLSFQNIGLRPGQWRAIEKKARHSGKTAPEYVRSLIERDLLAEKSFDEILGPVREDFHRHGVTPEQLDQIVRRARRASITKTRRARS